MPSRKKKYNARFPVSRIKKIMQSDEEIGKVAQAVPIVISRTLELFVESLLEQTVRITISRNAKTLTPSHMKQCIMTEKRFDFLSDMVKNVPDIAVVDEPSTSEAVTPPATPSSTLLPATITSNGHSHATATVVSHNGDSSGASTSRATLPQIKIRVDLPAKYTLQHQNSAPVYGGLAPNFYTEATHTTPMPSTSSTASAVTLKRTQATDRTTTSGPRPKMSRLDSAPANLTMQRRPTAGQQCAGQLATDLSQMSSRLHAKSKLPQKFDMSACGVPPKTTQSPSLSASTWRKTSATATATVTATATAVTSPPPTSDIVNPHKMIVPEPPQILEPSTIRMDAAFDKPINKIDYTNLILNDRDCESPVPSTSAAAYASTSSGTSAAISVIVKKPHACLHHDDDDDDDDLDDDSGPDSQPTSPSKTTPTTLRTDVSCLELDEDYDNI